MAPSAIPTSPRTGVYCELHLHLGGAILPNILYSYLQRQAGHELMRRYPSHEKFEAFFAKKRTSLTDYLKMHSLVERIQRLHSLRYFVQRLVRGAALFDNLAYAELRYTPFFRTDEHLAIDQRIRQMREVVETVRDAADSQSQYGLRIRQILCIHSRLPDAVNGAIVDLAIEHAAGSRRSRSGASGRAGERGSAGVVAVDLAGPDTEYAKRLPHFVSLFKRARKAGLATTAHVFETRDGCYPELLPHLDRIGHGVQIPLRQPKLLRAIAKRGQCLELCPTTYVRTGTLPNYAAMHDIFARCFEAGVDTAICTDNSGLHQVRLPMEIENLLVRDIIDFHQVEACHASAYRHAFDWQGAARPL